MTPDDSTHMPSYPRISELLERIRETRESDEGHTAATIQHEGPVTGFAARALIADVVAPDVAMPMVPQAPNDLQARERLVAPERSSRLMRPGTDLSVHQRVVDTDVVVHAAGQPSEAELIRELSLRDLAREAVRSRMINFGEQRAARSAYEIVFLLLAFSVTVLLTAPLLVEILLAAHGSRP
jgi:hypothetical protein